MPRVGIIVITNAIIWGFVMIACSMALKGTGAYQEIQLILAGGALTLLMLVGSGALRKKPKE